MNESQVKFMEVQSRLVSQMMTELNEVIGRYDGHVMVSTTLGCLEILKVSLIAGHAYDVVEEV